MVSDRKWKEMLEKTDFEFQLDELKRMLDGESAMRLYAFLEKWGVNMLAVTALRMCYADEFIAASDLDPSDPRYNPHDGWEKYAPEGADARLKRASDILTDFEPLGEQLPLVTFAGDALAKAIEREKELRALERGGSQG